MGDASTSQGDASSTLVETGQKPLPKGKQSPLGFNEKSRKKKFFPQLKVDNQEQCVPKNGRWNFEDKKLLQAIPIECWAIVSFSARCDLSHLSREMINCGRSKGIIINRPFPIIEESHQCARMGPSERVETIFEEVIKRLPGPPQLLLCVLPERKNSPTYDWYSAGVRTQSAKVEMVDSLYKPLANGLDDGMMRYQRGTSAVSIAARQMSQFIKLEEDFSKLPEAGAWDSAVPDMPRLHEDVWQSMFFC
ncbi:hypothetical protein HPP92_000191 [Vanilla planifolia]|uniref:Protein argonaute Mid domain-containing protein n=1 Tax=Vanilla planifolia TaxID=51239 RepID=A0A835RNC8_VANPL|nr:hypothetical protein HPP92_000191 [Vanilla planifolia]